jgi:regulator of cell morphogenesis and NO signaling
MPAPARNLTLEVPTRSPSLPGNDTVPRDLPALVDHIVERYHRTHLRELPVTISLAREVEGRYAGDPACPIGLADHLSVLAKDLETHQWREEATLFPLIRIGTPMCLKFVMRRMMDDHVDMDVRLMALERFTASYRPSFEAPLCWQALSFMCRKFVADLREHARLEHEVLYALLAA